MRLFSLARKLALGAFLVPGAAGALEPPEPSAQPASAAPAEPNQPARTAPPAVTSETDARSVPPNRPNAVQVDLGLAVVGLAYERLIAARFAVQLEGQIFGTWFGPLFGLPAMRGLGGQVRPTLFVTQDGPRGVYVAPFLRVDSVSAEKNDNKGSAVGFSTGLFAGYSFLFADRINLRIGAGPQFLSYVVDVAGTRVAFKQLFPGLDLVVGYVF